MILVGKTWEECESVVHTLMMSRTYIGFEGPAKKKNIGKNSFVGKSFVGDHFATQNFVEENFVGIVHNPAFGLDNLRSFDYTLGMETVAEHFGEKVEYLENSNTRYT